MKRLNGADGLEYSFLIIEIDTLYYMYVEKIQEFIYTMVDSFFIVPARNSLVPVIKTTRRMIKKIWNHSILTYLLVLISIPELQILPSIEDVRDYLLEFR